MVQEGMITLTPVEVVKYTHRIPGAFPPGLTVGRGHDARGDQSPPRRARCRSPQEGAVQPPRRIARGRCRGARRWVGLPRRISWPGAGHELPAVHHLGRVAAMGLPAPAQPAI